MGHDCGGCANDCEVVVVSREGEFLDAWGNRCPKGRERVRTRADAAEPAAPAEPARLARDMV